MLVISHRGNIAGPETSFFGENHPKSIEKVINLGFHCEIDLWLENNKFYLGHDIPEYEVDFLFLKSENLWIHCKNVESLIYLSNIDFKNEYFYHQNDDVILTSGNYLWHYPKLGVLGSKSIAVLPERVPFWDLSQCFAVCTDFVNNY